MLPYLTFLKQTDINQMHIYGFFVCHAAAHKNRLSLSYLFWEFKL